MKKEDNGRHTGLLFLKGPKSNASDASFYLEAGGDDFLKLTSNGLEFVSRVQKILTIKRNADALRTSNYRLEQLNRIDDLTGVLNMKGFSEKFEQVVTSCHKSEVNVGIIMIDLDYFKSVNDEANHLMGSFCLSVIGGILSSCKILKKFNGSIARYGGDEFIAYCTPESLDELIEAAEEIREEIEKHQFSFGGFEKKITASLGASLAKRGFQGKGNDIIRIADEKLYESKHLGRNKVYSIIIEKTNL